MTSAGLARRTRRLAEHHPLEHGGGQGGGQGYPRAERQADRDGVPRAHAGRVRGRPHRQAGEGGHLRRDLRQD